ncbi:uncharacterized protein ACDP82_000495 [Pangshura tecta]
MSTFNQTCPNPSTFLLIGIPGLESEHIWISIPFCLMYVIALLGNGTVLFIVKQEQTLHEPMYYFLSMLAVIDLVFSTAVVPKMLSIFWLDSRDISFEACFLQMFFIHTFTVVESGVLLAMSLDRYVAICNPLRYNTIVTSPKIAQIGLLSLARGVGVVMPLTCLLTSLPYCKINVIPHSYCEYLAVMELACADSAVTDLYSIIVATALVGTDFVFIAFSYGMILRSVLRLSSQEARLKAFSTCSSHVCIILLFYLGGLLSMYLHIFKLGLAHHIQVLVADLYLVIPPMLNPVIYGIKSKQIRKRVFKLFGQRKSLAEPSTLDIVKEGLEEQPNQERSIIEHVMQMKDRIAQVTPIVREHMEKAQETQQTYYNRQAMAQKFQVGNRVMVLVPTVESKLLARCKCIMLPFNGSCFNPKTFLLIGIPELETLHVLISVPFCSMYVIAILGNCTILFIIKTEPSLHEPMFFFLSMLAVIDLVLSTSTMPKLLGIFWFSYREIGLDACLLQMFVIHSFSAMESGIFLAMAFDRYVAICDPLRHKTVLTNTIVAKIGLVAMIRGVLYISPLPFLVQQYAYYRTNIIAHSYCEHMAVVILVCGDITISNLYGLTTGFLVLLLDSLFIILSYIMILRAVLRLASAGARLKTFSTCISHICAILAFYTPIAASSLTHRFGQNVSPHIHILLANFYLLVPPMLNPIVYGARTKQIRQRVLKMVSLGRQGL